MIKEVTLQSFKDFRSGLITVVIISVVVSLYLLLQIKRGKIKDEWLLYLTKALGFSSIMFGCWLYTTYTLDYMFMILFIMVVMMLGFIYNLSMSLYIKFGYIEKKELLKSNNESFK